MQVKPLRFCTFVLALIASVVFIASSSAMTVKDEVRALIGVEYTPYIHGERIIPSLSCTIEGGGLLNLNGVSFDEWSFGMAKCRDRTAVILKKAAGEKNGRATWHIVDALLLPPVETEWIPRPSDALQLALMGECALDGRTDTSFFALVRWKDRERVDWKTGVEHAWAYDIEKGRIVPVSSKRIVCEWLEP